MVNTPHDQRHPQAAFQQWRPWTNSKYIVIVFRLLLPPRAWGTTMTGHDSDATMEHDDGRARRCDNGRAQIDDGTRWQKGKWGSVKSGAGARDAPGIFFFHTLLIFIGYGIGWCWCQSGWYSCLYHGIFIFVFYMLSENFLTILWFGNYLIC